jgi:hypothetical protein
MLHGCAIGQLRNACEDTLDNFLQHCFFGEGGVGIKFDEFSDESVVGELIYAFHQRLEGVHCIVADVLV